VAEAAAPSVDDLRGRIDALRAKAAPAAPGGDAAAPGEAEAPSVDDLKARISALPRPSAPPQAPVKSGYAANVGAGALEGVAGSINLATDPASSFLSMLKVPNLLIAAHDALAGTTVGKALGADKPFTPEAKNYLLGADTTPGAFGSQPDQGYGSNLVHMLGTAAGVQPEDITAATPGQRIAREAATGATMGAFTGNLLAVPAGAAGSIGASELPRMLPKDTPELLKALAELPAGVLSALAVGGAGAGAARFAGPPARATGNALARPVTAAAGALDRFAAGADRTPPEGTPPGTPPEAPAPAPGGAPGEAQPAGAMVTPPPAAARTAREIGHGNTVADEEWLNTPQQPGVRDTRVLVEGNTPTLTEQEQTVETARELKRLRNEHTEVSQDERQLLHDASENRKTAFKEAVPSDLTLDAQEKQAGSKIESDLQNVWAKKKAANWVPVQTQIATELEGSAGHLPPLKSAMEQVTASLENAGTDPQAMYKTHRLINFLQSKQGLIANPGYGAADVQAALTRVKGVLAGEIDTNAPGFAQVMKAYSDTIGPIRAAQALNERYSGLFDTRGYMNFNRVHELMKDVIQAGHPDAPTSDLRGISDFQLQRLKDIHDDLRRSASAQDLAKAYGSDTAQNVMDIIKGVGKTAGSLAVRGAAAYALGPVGPFAVDAAGRIIGARRAAAGKEAGVARGREMLRPPPSLLINPNAPP
jgi:hypothetical protein